MTMRNSYVLTASASMMLLTQFLRKANRTIRGLASATLLALFLLPAGSRAANVTVGCPGAAGGPFDYSSLTAALSAFPLTNVTITVSGTCTEAVVINGAQNLQIISTPGAGLVDPGGSPANFGAVMEIDNSQNVIVQGLSIEVASRTIDNAIPVILVQTSDVRIVQDRIEGAGASDGIDMFEATVRLIGATTIENNNDGLGDGEGVFLQGPNAALILLGDASGNCPLIQGNGDSGIFSGGGGTTVRAPGGRGCATIQNNFSGIDGNLGATIVLNVLQANPGAVKLLNNSFGLVATNGTHFNLEGPVLIQGNAVDGVRLRNAFGSLTGSDGTAGPVVQQNGTSLNPPCCAPAAGISLANNATLDLTGGQVTNNAAPGVIAQDNSSVRLIGQLNQLSISKNPIGVEVTDASSAAFFMAPSISGNSSADVVCGPDAVAHGDLSAAGKLNCPQFRPQQNAVAPPRHGKIIP
jgi:hypothetical protein